MDNVNIDKNLKTISNGVSYFTNIYQLFLLGAVWQIISGVNILFTGGPDYVTNAIRDFVTGGGYAIVAVGFYYLRKLFGAVRTIVEELRTTV